MAINKPEITAIYFARIGAQSQSKPQKGVLENSLASQASIKVGDRVLAIDGQSTENMNAQKATKIIRTSKSRYSRDPNCIQQQTRRYRSL